MKGHNKYSTETSRYYRIVNREVSKTDKNSFFEKEDTIAVITMQEFEADKRWQKFCPHTAKEDIIRICRVEAHKEYLYGNICVPIKGNAVNKDTYSFYIYKHKMIIISGQTWEEENVLLEQLKEYSREQFLYDCIVSLLNGDLQYMENIEKELTALEEQIFHNGAADFNSRMLVVKKHVFRFYRYYSQLVELSSELEGNEEGFLDEEQCFLFARLKEKAERLSAETQLLREYAMQIQSVYQSELGLRQNNIMKVLTIVTTIFLPLSLIAGWYGMNFYNIPELSWEYGYMTVVVISLFIVMLCLWIFKRKHFW